MNLPTIPTEFSKPSSSSVADELQGARDDLARLAVLLNDAFAELLSSFSAIQAAVQNGVASAAIDQHSMRAVTALQCEDMASQLITFTQKRLESARETLKNLPEMPQIHLTDIVWAAGLAACADLTSSAAPPPGPVRQYSMGAGDIDLF